MAIAGRLDRFCETEEGVSRRRCGPAARRLPEAPPPVSTSRGTRAMVESPRNGLDGVRPISGLGGGPWRHPTAWVYRTPLVTTRYCSAGGTSPSSFSGANSSDVPGLLVLSLSHRVVPALEGTMPSS
jgi:hypothetical protein